MSRDLPTPLLRLMIDESFGQRAPGYVRVDREGRVEEWGGELSNFGLAQPNRGDDIADHVIALYRMLPLDGPTMRLDVVELQEGVTVDIHVYEDAEHYWIVLLDASEGLEARRSTQQKWHDSSLLRARQALILDQYLERSVAVDLVSGALAEDRGGERRELTILFADIRGFTAFSEKNDPNAVFETLNLLLAAMIRPTQDETGVVNNIIGDAVMAIFGLLPGNEVGAVHAARAATEMVRDVEDMVLPTGAHHDTPPRIGVGIATGPVALGILGSKRRRTYTAIGHIVNLAARLAAEARPGEILVDATSYMAASLVVGDCPERELSLKGISTPVRVHSRESPLRY